MIAFAVMASGVTSASTLARAFGGDYLSASVDIPVVVTAIAFLVVVGAMVGGAGLAFYALIGFEDSVNVAEATQDPVKAYPRALFGGLAVAGAIYVAVTVLASMAVPTGTLADSTGPLLEVAKVGPLSVDEKVFSAIALFALANGALINMVMASRLLYGMSNENILPSFFGRVHGGRQTPLIAILATTALAVLLVSTATSASSPT